MSRRWTHKTEGGGGPLCTVATLITNAKLKVKEEEESTTAKYEYKNTSCTKCCYAHYQQNIGPGILLSSSAKLTFAVIF